jgi:hypothetical protein
LDIITAEHKKDKELTSKPDYHFLISLLPYLEKLSPLQNLEVTRKIQYDAIQAYKRKEAHIKQEMDTGLYHLSVPGKVKRPVIQNNGNIS